VAIDVRETLKSFLDWRRPGGALSAAGHAAILVAGVYAFSSAQPFQPAVEAVAVDVVSDQQFNEMMKGDKTSKVVAKEPERRIDRVAETKEDKDPGLEKKDVPTPPTKQEAKPEPKPEPEQKVAAIVPPTRPPELRVTPPVVAPTPPKPPVKVEEEEDDIDEQAELLRRKKIEDQKKAEDAAKAIEAKRKLDEKLKQEAQAQTKAAEEKKKLDEKLKAEAEAEKRAEEKRVADAKKKAEAEKKARDDKARKNREAKEAAEENKLFASISNKLQTSKEAPSSTGSTGATVSNRSTAGTATATGKKLSPSDRSQLIGILTEQMNRCISYSGTAPKTGPQLTFTLSREGGINGGVQLANGSGEANFRPFSEAAMRALRNCQPYRIPARFMDSYDDWKNVRLNIDTSDMQ
jgi:colicin import membrane protein